MKRKLDVSPGVKVISWLFISNIIKSLVQWAVLIMLVKYYAEDEVGMFTYATAFAAPFFMLSDMQLKSVLVVEPSGDSDNIYTYIYIRLATVVLTIVGLLSYFACFNKTNVIIIAVIIYKSAESLLDILYGYLQKIDKMTKMALLDILKNTISITACFLITVFLSKIEFTLFSLAAFSFIFVSINYLYLRIYYLQDESKSATISDVFCILKKSLPLGFSVFLSSYITNYPRIVMEHYCGLETLAFFGAYSYLIIGLFQINIPIQTFLRQRLSQAYQMCDKNIFLNKIKSALFFYIIIGFVLLTVFIFLSDIIVRILYQDSYVRSSNVLPIMIISQSMMSISGLFAIAVLSFNIYAQQLYISGLTLLIVIIFANILIPPFGIYGGAFTGLIAAIISLLSYVYLFTNKIKEWRI